MPKYIVTYGFECPCYGDTSVAADNVEQAVEIIKKEFVADTLIEGWDPNPDVGCENYRVVTIEDEDGVVVSAGFPLGMTMPDQSSNEPDGSTAPALSDGYAANFETLLRAGVNRDLALLSCIRKSDNAPVAMVVAVNWDEDAVVWRFAPLAVLCEGNPFDDYVPADGSMLTPKYVKKKKAKKKGKDR